MADHDLSIVGGDVVLAGGTITRVDIGVRNGTITTLADGGIDATTTIDATGLTVLPGLIDQHFHVFWNYGWETYSGATRAAAKGGITTVVDMPLDNPPTLSAELFRAKLTAISAECHVDFALFAGQPETDPDELDGMVEAGAVALKLFTGVLAPRACTQALTPGSCSTISGDAHALASSLSCTARTSRSSSSRRPDYRLRDAPTSPRGTRHGRGTARSRQLSASRSSARSPSAEP